MEWLILERLVGLVFNHIRIYNVVNRTVVAGADDRADFNWSSGGAPCTAVQYLISESISSIMIWIYFVVRGCINF